MKGRSLFVLVIGLVLSTLILSSCAPATVATEAPLPVVRYVNFKVYDPVYVAIDKGFCEKRGIKVEIIGDVLAGPTGIQAVAGGAAEGALSSLPAIVNANAAGLPIVGVSDIQSALPGQPLEYYYVLKDSPIQSIKDLAGKKHAVNLIKSSFHYTALMALEENGVPEDKVEFPLLSFDKQGQALLQGEVDVIGLMEPYNSQLLATAGDKVRLLYNAHDIFGEKQFTTHLLNRIWAKDHPEQATAFVGCIVDAINWIEQNEEAAKPIIAKYTGIPAEFIPEYHFQKNGQVIEKDVQFWYEYLLKRGDITADWLKVNDIANNDYNPYMTGK